MIGKSWTCPHCNEKQTVSNGVFSTDEVKINNNGSVLGRIGIEILSIVCANEDCNLITLSGSLHKYLPPPRATTLELTSLLDWDLLPESSAKPQPEYIPEAIKEDYYEACKIKNLSPKASATLARRCLQGMIRNFANIKGKTLFLEIEKLKKAVKDGVAPREISTDSVDAIDEVRSIGAIGAHMEKDVNHIIEIDPDEAQTLLELIETLFEDWYVAKNKRELRFAKIKKLSDEKKADKQAKPEPSKS